VSAPTLFDRARLREIPLLKDVSDEVLGKLAPFLFECRFAAGDTILREGEYCDGAYYLISGKVEVRLRAGEAVPTPRAPKSKSPGLIARLRGMAGGKDAEKKPQGAQATVVLPELPVDLARGESKVLGAGDIFGEGSALSRYPIATDIVAIADVRGLLVRTPALRKMFELEEFASFKDAFDKRYKEVTLRAHLRRVPLFKDVGADLLDDIAAAVELVNFKPNKPIVKQGDATEAFYLVRAGYVKIGMQVGGKELAVSYLRKGDFAGEASLLIDDEPWPYSLTALEHVELVKIPGDRMRKLIAKYPAVERRLWSTLVSTLKRRSSAVADPVGMQYLQYAMDSGLIHGDSVLMIDLERCTRCDECVKGCADAHDGTPRFVREGARFRNFTVPTACYQCTDPVCMIGCPTGAITRPLGTKEVVIDQQTCIGCGNCVRRCPWQNILTVPFDSPATGTRIELATKCDLCVGREAGPACVQMCPHEAAIRVSFKDQDEVEALLSR
jgi:CRP-like cAMP-binding protein/Fe-S-cluster-containing hydrogenase component 2